MISTQDIMLVNILRFLQTPTPCQQQSALNPQSSGSGFQVLPLG